MSSRNNDDDNDNAIHRLVASITGKDASPDLVSLAKRVLSSQIGSGDVLDEKELAATWRRISRKAPNAKTAKDDVERLYYQYQKQSAAAGRGAPNTRDDVPPKMLVVLTKLMGKRIPTFSTAYSSTNAIARQGAATKTKVNPTTTSYFTAQQKTARTSPSRKMSPIKQRLLAYNQQQQQQHHFSPASSMQASAASSPSRQKLSQISPSKNQQEHLQQQQRYPTPPPKHPQTSSYMQQQSSKPGSPMSPSSSSPLTRRAALKYGLAGENQQQRNSRPQKSNESNLLTTNQQRQQQDLRNEEDVLLRECLYSLQGIDGERIRYYHRDPWDTRLPDIHTYEGIRVDSSSSPALDQTFLYTGQILETRLGTGAHDALRICGEAGWLYSRIQSYIQEVQHEESKGVVARAFAQTLAEQLRDYHSLLTTYETRLPDFSLRQLMVELKGPTNRLKILAMLTDGLRQYTGGRLLSALYRHSIHGNSVHTSIVQTLLNKASRPWFEILFLWTTQGVLSDPWNEFFVVENVEVEDKLLWTEKYSINYDRVPIGILAEHLVLPAFKVGKGINFVRKSLIDGRWTMDLSRPMSDARMMDDDDDNGKGNDSWKLGYRYKVDDDGLSKDNILQKTLNTALKLVHSHILVTLKGENQLMHHLFALKQFLFLGQGDFFSSLMEGLHQEFSNAGEPGGVSSIYKHTLLGIVEGALRSTNAKYLPQCTIDRLQVELLLQAGEEVGDALGEEKDPQETDHPESHRTVYDIFMLDYMVPDPILAIVHSNSMDRYKSVFSLLFRLKKIEFMLNYTWRQSATLSHALQTSTQYTGIDVRSSDGYAQATFLLRNISILRQSMMHFVVNLKSYLMFEVIEGAWQKLKASMEEASSLDEAIAAHDAYLASVVRKAMVRDQEHSDGYILNHLADQVATVLSITDEFCTLQEIIFNQSLRAADVAAEKRVEAESRMNRGQWGFDNEQDIEEQETFFGLAEPAILEEIRRMSESYNDHSMELLRVLNEKVNGSSNDWIENDANVNNVGPDNQTRVRQFFEEDLDPQRFLIAQLDHNGFYTEQSAGAN